MATLKNREFKQFKPLNIGITEIRLEQGLAQCLS